MFFCSCSLVNAHRLVAITESILVKLEALRKQFLVRQAVLDLAKCRQRDAAVSDPPVCSC